MKMFEVDRDNVERFQDIIDNYEGLVKELNQELCELKEEQNDLKAELSVVLAENKKLSNDFQIVLSQKQCDICESDNNKEIITNLKEQINTLITEKEYVTRLWQEGVKTIDHLEDELNVYRAGHESFVPKKEFQKLKYFYEEKINDLELKLNHTEKKLEDCTKQARVKIETKCNEVEDSLQNQSTALKIVKNLEAEVLKLQTRLQETVEEKVRIERSLENREQKIQNLKTANSECLARVTEAVSVVEAALNEKDAALFRERTVKEENEKLVQEMTEIVKESQEKLKQEKIRISAEYNEKQKSMLEELSKAHNEIENKSSEIEALKKKCCLLENEIERMHKGHCTIDESEINKLLVLEKNLESTFQKLLLSEKQNIQLASEKEIMKNDLDQMANIYDRNLKAKEIEISTLKSKINRLESDLNTSYEQINRITERMAKVNEQITRTEKEFNEQKENYEKNLKTAFDEQIEKLTRNFNSNIKELQLQIEKKNEINQKWRKESKNITDNFEKLAASLKQEIQSLKKENKTLKDSLKKSDDKVRQYKTFLELISKDVNKISHLTLGTGIS